MNVSRDGLSAKNMMGYFHGSGACSMRTRTSFLIRIVVQQKVWSSLQKVVRTPPIRGIGAVKLTSGPTFSPRNASLCSHSLGEAVKRIHRMPTFNLCANVTHTARVSGSAFVLSGSVRLVLVYIGPFLGAGVLQNEPYQ